MRRWLAASLSLLAVVVGCSQAPTQQAEQNPFDEEFGGFTTSSEAPGFGDATLVSAAVTDEVDPSDPICDSIKSGDPGRPGIRRQFLALRVIWGQPRYDSASTTPTVWDGKLTVKGGRIGVARVIRFEPATDWLLPRTEPGVISWVSQTTVHNDGLLCLIGLPRPDRPDSTGDTTVVDTVPPADTLPPLPELTVSFETSPLSISFSLPELLALDTVIAVDDRGNVVMFHCMLVEPGACPRGFLGGEWVLNEEGSGGEFKGRWASENGELSGYLMGRFGVNSNGRRVFFGKYIDEAGNFEGRLRGVWLPTSRHPRAGVFMGVFYTPTGEPAGRLHGRWAVREEGGGCFQGVWKTQCPSWDRGVLGWAHWDDEYFDKRGL